MFGNEPKARLGGGLCVVGSAGSDALVWESYQRIRALPAQSGAALLFTHTGGEERSCRMLNLMFGVWVWAG